MTELPKIGSPATRVLASVGITTLEGVAKLGEKDLLAIHGVGSKAIRILRDALASSGKELKP